MLVKLIYVKLCLVRKRNNNIFEKEGFNMAWIEAECKKENKEENSFLRILDRGIDDMEAGRELPLEEAFQKINELRTIRRNARV